MEKTRARRICSVEGCGRIHVAKGFCRSHYQRFVGNLNYQSAPKFIRLYGKTLRDLSMDLRVPIPSVWQLHKTGQLGAVVSQVTSA